MFNHLYDLRVSMYDDAGDEFTNVSMKPRFEDLQKSLPPLETLTYLFSSADLSPLIAMKLTQLREITLSLNYSYNTPIGPVIFSSHELTSFFLKLPHLQSLALRWLSSTSDNPEVSFSPFLKAVSSLSSDGKLICPKLASLDLQAVIVDYEDLVEFLHLRSGGNDVAVCRVTLQRCYGMHDVVNVDYNRLDEAFLALDCIRMPFV